MGTQLWRILIHPRFEVADKGSCVAFVISYPIRLSKNDEVLMTAELSRDLLIAYLVDVELVNSAPVLRRGTPSANGLQVPINRIPKRKLTIAKQIKLARDNTIAGLNYFVSCVGPAK